MPEDSFLWIGNHPATDLCNTTPVIDGQEVELLPDLEAVARWARVAGVDTTVAVSDLAGREGSRTLDFVHRLRAAARTALEGAMSSGPSIDALNDLLRDQRGALHVDPGAEEPVVMCAAEPGEQVRLDIASAVIDIFRYEPHRIRRCANPACVLLFLDVSKSGRRRWCDMATCGNRAKAAAHHRRTTR